MSEIERIIKDYCDGPYPVSEDGTDSNGKTYKDFAKAIEQYVQDKTERYEERLATQKGIILNHVEQERLHKQYVIKARIKDLKGMDDLFGDVKRSKDGFYTNYFSKLIKELKKGLL